MRLKSLHSSRCDENPSAGSRYSPMTWVSAASWLLSTLLFAAPTAGAVVSEQIMGVATVIDGDTIEIHRTRIRLHGIDAPESSQLCQLPDNTRWRCGQQAALALQDRIGRSTVMCLKRDIDRYGRLVGQCSVDGSDINAWMVENGWALAYRRYSTDYVSAEQVAREAAVGVWSGKFIMPWEWRRGERLEAANDKSAGDCRIKGNISRSGERIYHIPGGRYYARTRIDESKGERWFCTEAEARVAGWRKSLQ